MIKINVLRDYTDDPGGRFGNYSGEDFRERILIPKYQEALQNGEKIEINLDGGYGYFTSFLEEAFGGMVRKLGHTHFMDITNFISEDEPSLIDDIRQYVENAIESQHPRNLIEIHGFTDDEMETVMAIKRGGGCNESFQEYWKERCANEECLSPQETFSILSYLAASKFMRADWHYIREKIEKTFHPWFGKKESITLEDINSILLQAFYMTQLYKEKGE
jgi:hypothetical protein